MSDRASRGEARVLFVRLGKSWRVHVLLSDWASRGESMYSCQTGQAVASPCTLVRPGKPWRVHVLLSDWASRGESMYSCQAGQAVASPCTLVRLGKPWRVHVLLSDWASRGVVQRGFCLHCPLVLNAMRSCRRGQVVDCTDV